MATVMSQMPDVWRRVLAEHVPDGAHRCRACCSPSGIQASWPCQTFKVADEARALSEGYLPVPSAPSPRAPGSGSYRSYETGVFADSWSTPDPSWAESAWSQPSWQVDPWSSTPADGFRSREIADLPAEPRDPDRWDHDLREPWSYGASFGAGGDGAWSR